MKKTKKIAVLALASLLALSLAACDSMSGKGGTGTGSGSGDSSNGTAVLPGEGGGSSNANDTFAGKTFYNDSDEAKAVAKYVFGTDGTYTVSSRLGSYSPETGYQTYGDFEKPNFEYKYSFSSDGKTVYVAINKVSFTNAFGKDNERLMTYSEFESLVNSDAAKAIFKKQWDEMTDEQKKSALQNSELDENAGFDGYYQAGLKFWQGIVEQAKQYFSIVLSYDISTEKDSANVSCTLLSGTVDSSTKDLSKMNFFTGRFVASPASSPSINSFSIYLSDSGYLSFSSGSMYNISKIDAAKIYFEPSPSGSSSSGAAAEPFEAAYTVEGSGKDTKIKVTFPADKGGETVELTFTPDTMSLYEAK